MEARICLWPPSDDLLGAAFQLYNGRNRESAHTGSEASLAEAIKHEMDLVTDPRLLERLRASDPAALDELLAAWWQPLVRYAVRLIRDRDLAEDLVQETFVRLWLRRDRLEPGSLRSFLYRVLHNLAMDDLRRRQTRERSLLRLATDGNDQAAPEPATETATSTDSEVTRAIDALPPRRREAFILAYQHQLSYREIADVMEVSPATVKNQVAAALAQLRESLRDAIIAFREPG